MLFLERLLMWSLGRATWYSVGDPWLRQASGTNPSIILSPDQQRFWAKSQPSPPAPNRITTPIQLNPRFSLFRVVGACFQDPGKQPLKISLPPFSQSKKRKEKVYVFFVLHGSLNPTSPAVRQIKSIIILPINLECNCGCGAVKHEPVSTKQS